MLVRDLIVYSIFSISGVTATPIDYSQYVNPFIGSEGPIAGKGFGGGDIFVGGALPFGVVKVGIDTTAANWSIAVLNGGWTPDGNVTGISTFSHGVCVYRKSFNNGIQA